MSNNDKQATTEKSSDSKAQVNSMVMPVIIKNPSKQWWSGDSRVEEFMPKILDAINRHLPKGA